MGGGVVQIERRFTRYEIPIPGGATGLSDAFDLKGYTIAAIVVPAGWTAADITFQASEKIDGTYQDVINDKGNEVVITTGGAGRYIVLGANDADGRRDEQLLGVQFLKVRSGTSGTPVNQTTTKTLILICTTK